MAIQIFGFIFLNEWEKRLLSAEELALLVAHENSHRPRKFKPTFSIKSRWQEERQAQLEAINLKQKEGLDIDKLIQMEVDYRFMQKYGMRLKEFKEFIKKNATSI